MLLHSNPKAPIHSSLFTMGSLAKHLPSTLSDQVSLRGRKMAFTNGAFIGETQIRYVIACGCSK